MGSIRDTKVCPACAEEIKAAAVVCRYCGYQYASAQTPQRLSCFRSLHAHQNNKIESVMQREPPQFSRSELSREEVALLDRPGEPSVC